MANYYLNNDGSISTQKKKKKGNEYVLNNDGTITQINAPVVQQQPQPQPQQQNNGGFLKGGSSNFLEGLWNSYWDLTFSGIKGAAQTLEGVADTAQYLQADYSNFLASQINNKLSQLTMGNVKNNVVSVLFNTYANELKENAKYNSTASLLGENANDQDNILRSQIRNDIKNKSYMGDMSNSIYEGGGNIAAMAALSAVGGAAMGTAGVGVTQTGALTTGGKLALSGGSSYMSAYGNARSEAYRNGANDDEANKAGVINGLAEAISEQFFDSMPGIKSAGFADKIGIKDFLTNKLKGAFGTNAGRVFLKLVGGLEEGAEEMISNAFVAVGNDLMHMLDQSYTYGMENQSGNPLEDGWNALFSEDSIKSFTSAGLTSVLLGVGGNVMTTAQTNQVINAFAKDNNISFKEAKAVLEGQTLETQKGLVREESNKGNIEVSNEVDLEDAAKQRIINFMKAHQGENVQNYIEDLVKEEEKRNNVTYTDEQRVKVANEIRNKMIDEINNKEKYTAFTLKNEPTNESEKEVYEEFKKYANNTKQSHDLYQFYTALKNKNEKLPLEFINNEELVKRGILEKSTDKDGNTIYGKNVDGKFEEMTINGYNTGDKVLINVEGKNALEATTWHEIAHSIKDADKDGYEKLKEIVNEVYGEDDFEKNYRTKYEKMYGNIKNLEDEYINDKLGEMLNNEDFVNRVSGNQGLFKQIINSIRNTIKYMTSSSEKKQLMKLQKKLEDKYMELYKEAKFKSEVDESLPFYEDEKPKFSLTDNDITNEKTGYENVSNNLLGFSNSIANQKGFSEEKYPYTLDLEISTDGGETFFEDSIKGMNRKQAIERAKRNWEGAILREVKEQPKFSLSQDNTGKELTKEQQEYFKDSKVRDQDGRLLEVYHGTPNAGFTIYDNNRLGETTGADDTSLGFHLTDNEQLASFFSSVVGDEAYNEAKQEINAKYDINEDSIVPFAEQAQINQEISALAEEKAKQKGEVKHQYINITKPLSVFADYGIDESQLARDLVYAATGEEDISNVSDYYESNEDMLLAIQQNFDDELAQLKDELAKPESIERIKEMGYDGLILPMTNKDKATIKGTGNEYVVFNSNQIKNTDNTNPTENQDIRYSLSVEQANTGTDNTGKELSKGQQEYFKNSKTTDENGNLIKVYHTMTNTGTQFNEFNPVGTEGYKFGDKVVNFFTNSKTMSGSYADYKYTMADTTKLNNIEQAKEWIQKQNSLFDKYDIKGYGDKGYSVTSNDSAIISLHFDNEADLLKNIKQRFYEYNKQFGGNKGQAKYQYEGYLNITNPYIIDANENNWDGIVTGYDNMNYFYAQKISQEDKEQLIELAKESRERSNDPLTQLSKLFNEMSDIQQKYNYAFKEDSTAYKNNKDYKRWLELKQQVKEVQSKHVYEDTYFRENAQDLIEKINNELNMGFSEYEMFQMADREFTDEALKDVFSYTSTTNEIVQDVLRKNQNGANYDGIIIKRVMDYGSTTEFDDTGAAQDVYVTFNSNQFKAADNLNPTQDADIRYSLSTDSKGRELSPQQQEYFSNSKVRDADGNLLEVYHGTNSNFNTFRSEFNEFYFTDDENAAADYGGTIREEYLNLTNPYIVDFEGRNDKANDLYENGIFDVIDYAKENGYDGVIAKNTFDGANTHTQYVAFEPNQIKNINNVNPTLNNDTRYSLSADGLKNLANELGESYSTLESNLTGRDRVGIKSYLENHTGIVDKYLADNNIKVEPVYRDIEFSRIRTPELQQFVRDNDLDVTKLANDQELQDKYFDLWFEDMVNSDSAKSWRDMFDYVKDNDSIPSPLRVLDKQMTQIRNGETQEIDEYATKSKKLDAAIDNGYDFWIEDVISPLFEKIDYDVDEVMEEAKANHGTTNDYNTGAYMTTDGELLDFSDGGYRDDHRTISVFNLDMNEFMDYGAIRMKPEAPGFEMAQEPTKAQYDRLTDYIEYLKDKEGAYPADNSYINIDCDIPGTNNYNTALYKISTPTSKIISDIKEYWKTGQFPQKSEYADFYYSLSKNEERPHTTGTYGEDIRLRNIGEYNLPTQEASPEAQNLPITEQTEPEDRLVEQRQNLAEKRLKAIIEKQTYKSAKAATKVAKDYLGFNSQETKEFRDGIEKLAKKPKDNLIKAKNYEEVKNLVSKYANRDMTFVSEELKEAQKDVRHTQLIVSDDLKKQITDWTDFRKRSGLNIKKGQKSNVDVVYQELCEMYPGMFDESITNYADQLQAMSEFVHRDNKFVEHYTLDDNTINRITNSVWEKLSQNALTKQEISEIENDINNQVERRTREVVQNALLEEMGITTDDIDVGKDITSLAYQRTDPKRVNEKVFGYDTGQKINDATTNFVGHQEAERIRFVNQEKQEIKDLGIKARSKESAAVQKYGEKQYVNKFGELVDYTDKDLMNEFPKYEDQQRIKNAARVLREKYDAYIDKINDSLIDMGYDPIPKRQDYFKHFTELEDKFSQWGLPFSRENLNAEELPTDINGLTDQFKPGKNFFASAMQRKGLKTTYDAITGIDKYLDGASNLMYHTESIQRYRTLSKFIRNTYGQTHGLEDIESLTPEQAAQRVEDVYNNKLSRYAAWLDEQANALAGKKGGIDRAAERLMGRKVYTLLSDIKKQVGSNMTGFNVRSAMTNFASAIQGASKTQKLGLLEGTAFALKNYIHEDSDFINKSDFLVRRFGTDQLSKKAWQKISEAGQVFMNATDRFTSLQIWGGKYYEGLNKGLTQEAAIKQADDFAARIMGDRSKGQTAEIFNSKTLGLLTQFQLEVNNQWSSMVHDNKMEMQKNPGVKSALRVVSQLGQLYAASYFFNSFMKALTGSDVMFDPIKILMDIFAPPDDDEEVNYEERATKALGELINQIPMASIFTGGRIPISEAFTGVSTLGKKLTGQKGDFGTEITWDDVKDDLIASAFYYLMPTGFGQLKKTAQGLGMYGQVLPEPIEQALDIYHNENINLPGNYTKTGRFKYEAPDTTEGKVQAALFGRNANANAQEYREKGYLPLTEKAAIEARDANLPISEYREYKDNLKKVADEAKANDESQSEAKADFIYNLPYDSDQKNVLINGALNRKNPVDIDEYGKYGTLEELDYANKNPEKYNVIRQISSYDKYQEYQDWIQNLKKLYKNQTARKRAVQEYINTLPLNRYQKMMLENTAGGYSIKSYKSEMKNYINTLPLSAKEKENIDKELFS